MSKCENEFTDIIHNKGWKVYEACEFWGIRLETYYKRVNNPKLHEQLRSMCKGLEQK